MTALVLTKKTRLPDGIAQALTVSQLTPIVLSPLANDPSTIEVVEKALTKSVCGSPVVIFIDGIYSTRDIVLLKKRGKYTFADFRIDAIKYSPGMGVESFNILQFASIATIGHTTKIVFFVESPSAGLTEYLKHLGADIVWPHLTSVSSTAKSIGDIVDGVKKVASGVASVAESAMDKMDRLMHKSLDRMLGEK